MFFFSTVNSSKKGYKAEAVQIKNNRLFQIR